MKVGDKVLIRAVVESVANDHVQVRPTSKSGKVHDCLNFESDFLEADSVPEDGGANSEAREAVHKPHKGGK